MARGGSGLTIEALDAAPHGIDLGPLQPSLLRRLETTHAESLIRSDQGRVNEALAEAEKCTELSKRSSRALGVLGDIYARSGKRSEAEAVLRELKEMYANRKANGYDVARVCLSLGDKDQGLEWLEKDFQSRNATMPNFLTMSPFDLLHDDPRFQNLVRRIGLPELK